MAGETGRRIGAIVALRYSDWIPDRGTYGAIRWRADSDKLGKEWITPVTPTVRDTMEKPLGHKEERTVLEGRGLRRWLERHPGPPRCLPAGRRRNDGSRRSWREPTSRHSVGGRFFWDFN
jgi:integrase